MDSGVLARAHHGLDEVTAEAAQIGTAQATRRCCSSGSVSCAVQNRDDDTQQV
jgi:hypothetical protein